MTTATPSESVAQCLMQPSVFDPYEKTTVRIHVKPSKPVPAGTLIECQLPNSFFAHRISQSHTQRLQATDPDAPHFVRVHMADFQLEAEIDVDVEIAARELITDKQGNVRHGQRVLATVQGGDIPAGAEIVFLFANMYTPWIANQSEYYYVAIGGEAVEPWPTFWVKGGAAAWHRLIVPSSVRPGEPFRVLLVALDKYDNVASTAYENVTLALEGGAALEEHIAFEGRYETMVALPEAGVYRLVAKGLREEPDAAGCLWEGILSNPIRITEQPQGPYWGDIHIHSHISADAVGNEPYAYARDVSGLDFAGVCDHANAHLPVQWQRIKEWARMYDEPGAFVTVLGFESSVVDKGRYHSNVYFRDLEPQMEDIVTEQGSSMKEANMREMLARYDALHQLHQSGTCATDMRDPFFPQTRVIEIYSHWGESEYYNPDHALSYENNRIRYPETRITISGRGPYYARDAWAEGKRFMTIGSSDDHFGQGGKAHRGVTAVYSPALTRGSIFDQMRAGTCYATTGERILLEFQLNGQPMGSQVTARPGDSLEFTFEVYGTNVLAVVEAFCYRFDRDKKWASAFYAEIPDQGLQGSLQRDLAAGWTEAYEGPAVYYLRVRQKHYVKDRPVYAWSSPIWVVDEE